MEEEQFVSGFCKAQNQSRMVECIFEVAADGSRRLTETDCAYGNCPHTDDCLLMKNVLEHS